MTTDTLRDSFRWRDAQHRGYLESVQASQSTEVSCAAADSQAQTWNRDQDGRVEQRAQKLPLFAESYAHSPGFRRNQPLDGREDQHSRRNERLTADPTLTLDIPKSQDLLLQSPGQTTISSESGSRSTHFWSPRVPSLPSFATLQEHAGCRINPEEGDALRSTCQLCSKLKPLVKEAADVLAELDENLQLFCNNAVTRIRECPQECPIRSVLWIIERLRNARADLQRTARSEQAKYGQHQSSPGGVSPDFALARNSLKRPAEHYDSIDPPLRKRERLGTSPAHATIFGDAVHHRRPSLDVGEREPLQHTGLTPPPTDSFPNSAHPRTGSPSTSARLARLLPSPSSVAYPSSAAPSLGPQTAPSVGSPAASHQLAPSIHSVSTSSATSAHMTDLQHQVSLKSLALQTLQSEHASLLAKLQRLNVKTQTIEKKSKVADQEVNELTDKNEDLARELQSLKEQLEESERRREKQREDAAREKEQWLQMLAQGQRLQEKYKDDKNLLAQHIFTIQAETQHWENSCVAEESGTFDKRPLEQSAISQRQPRAGQYPRDVPALQAQVEILRLALEETRRHNQILDERAGEVLQRSSHIQTTLERALNYESSQHITHSSRRESERGHESRRSPAPRSISTSTASGENLGPILPDRFQVANSITTLTRSIMADTGKLGAEMITSLSTPEDVIKALGPLPSAHAEYRTRQTSQSEARGLGKIAEGVALQTPQREGSSNGKSPPTAVNLEPQGEPI